MTEKHYKIYDLQLEEYSRFDTIEELYEVMVGGSCLCGDGHDVLDKKDGKMKCINCRRVNYVATATEEEMKKVLEDEFGFRIEEVDE